MAGVENGPVRVERRGQIAIVTLDRPKANAVDARTSVLLYEAFAAIEADPSVRGSVLTGGGPRFFCAGWDLKAAADGEAADADFGPGGFAGITEFFGRRKPIVGAVNGLALGGGFELALACDLVVAADHAEFGLPEVTLGLVADSGGLLRIPQRVPRAIAAEMLLTGRRVTAAEAARWGLVNASVAAQDVVDAALALAEAAVAGAPLAVAAVLEVLESTEGMAVQQGFARMRSGELSTYARVAGSEDAQEGPRAFVEGRSPVWTGR
ncbi:MAG: enoyl-CoA hydratase-related protein [Actinomycetes bacterium]